MKKKKNIGIGVIVGLIAASLFSTKVFTFMLYLKNPNNPYNSLKNIEATINLVKSVGEFDKFISQERLALELYASYGLTFILGFVIALIALYFMQKAKNKNKTQN
ncbi:hypothetical protein [Campylobacter sp. RM12651]|uniref:hypothetical protein n=1 Tax=Campylobacter sp. RM12651 TaxID=1660079 RepID=UPI001EFAB956|nr:hypothetical protein [Campylobacter sp. RM12651]ULO03873.1 putative membrane protein [Campylobacter sp. RM12651]